MIFKNKNYRVETNLNSSVFQTHEFLIQTYRLKGEKNIDMII